MYPDRLRMRIRMCTLSRNGPAPMPTPTLKPIETRAYGCRFRSRLEARYAVFMTELGVEWKYEPEGFSLESGNYLPDFFLPRVRENGTWLEIKPHGQGSYFGFCASLGEGMPQIHDARLGEFADLAQNASQSFYVAYGLPSDAYLSSSSPDWYEEGMLEAPWDPFMWCICGCGKTAGIQFDGRGGRIQCRHTKGCYEFGGDKGYSHEHPLIVRAVTAARSARFEHGESP